MDGRLTASIHRFIVPSCVVRLVSLLIVMASSSIASGQTGNVSTTSSTAQAVEHPLMPAIRLCQTSVDRVQGVSDYEATFIKREQIGGQLVAQKMLMRFRERPFSVYLRSLEPNAGREVLFVSGQNGNQLLAHEGSGAGLKSLAGTIALPLDSPAALAENRHPITEIGMKNMLTLVLQQWELESKYQESQVRYFPNARLGDSDCEVIENSHPVPRRQFKFHMTRLFIDKQSRLPVRIENYGFPQANQSPPLIEEYTYMNVKINIRLTDQHFDRRNSEYQF